MDLFRPSWDKSVSGGYKKNDDINAKYYSGTIYYMLSRLFAPYHVLA